MNCSARKRRNAAKVKELINVYDIKTIKHRSLKQNATPKTVAHFQKFDNLIYILSTVKKF